MGGLAWAARRPDYQTHNSTNVRWCLIAIDALRGEFEAASKLFREHQARQEATGQSTLEAHAAHPGLLLLRRGDWEQAQRLLEDGLQWAVGGQNRLFAVLMAQRLGGLSLELEEFGPAEEKLLWAVDICRKGGSVIHELNILPVLCELYLRTGQLEKAQQHLAEAQAIVPKFEGFGGLPGDVYLAEGMVRAAEGRWQEAESAFQRAVSTYQEYSLPWDEAKVYYEWACALLASPSPLPSPSGRGLGEGRVRAKELLNKALALWEPMGAAPYAERCQKKLAELGLSP